MTSHGSDDPAGCNGFHLWKCDSMTGVQEWVASLPKEEVDCNSSSDVAECGPRSLPLRQDSQESCSSAQRKRGALGFNSGGLPSATDIYFLAISARKARDRQNKKSLDQMPPVKQMGEWKTEDRAEMMRAVFAAQRTAEPNNSFQSEFSNVSAESPLDYLFGGPPDPGPEEFLMQLGFGGPSVGVERVPERFLKPSQLHGVDVEKYLSIQHHLAEDVETGALGYRGLSGPATRRPSTIVSLIMDRIRDSQKDDWRRRAPSMAAGRDELLRVAEESTSSTDAEEVLDHDDGDDDDVPADDVPDEPAPDGQVQDFFLNVQQVDEHVCQVDEAVVDEPMTPITVSCLPVAEDATMSRKSSRSSRTSSLRRQERVYEDDDEFSLAPQPELPAEDGVAGANLSSLRSDATSGFFDADAVDSNIVVDSDASEIEFRHRTSSSVVASPQVETMEAVLPVLELAMEAYRTRLDASPASLRLRSVSLANPRDLNHNHLKEEAGQLVALRHQIDEELARTQRLLQALCQRIVGDRQVGALRNLLTDMTSLLHEQQHLHKRQSQHLALAALPGSTESLEPALPELPLPEPVLPEPAPPTEPPPPPPPPEAIPSSLPSASSCSCDAAQLGKLGCDSEPAWLRAFERRLTGHMRRTVRREVRKALTRTRSRTSASGTASSASATS